MYLPVVSNHTLGRKISSIETTRHILSVLYTNLIKSLFLFLCVATSKKHGDNIDELDNLLDESTHNAVVTCGVVDAFKGVECVSNNKKGEANNSASTDVLLGHEKQWVENDTLVLEESTDLAQIDKNPSVVSKIKQNYFKQILINWFQLTFRICFTYIGRHLVTLTAL